MITKINIFFREMKVKAYQIRGAGFENHPYYVLEQDIKQTQIVKPGCKECGYLKVHGKVGKVLKVYAKRDIADLKSARQWYMNGRILKLVAGVKR